MKWLKIVWHFVLRHLPRWLRFTAEVIEESHDDCPDCQGCDLFDECKEDESCLK